MIIDFEFYREALALITEQLHDVEDDDGYKLVDELGDDEAAIICICLVELAVGFLRGWSQCLGKVGVELSPGDILEDLALRFAADDGL